MSTDKATENHYTDPLLGLGLIDGLGPVAEVRCGRLQWSIPRSDYTLPERFRNNETHPLYDQAAMNAAVAALRKDAARWRQFRAMVGATRTAGYGGAAAFTFPSHIGLPPVGDIMRGSVALHLDAAVDAVIFERGAVGAA